MHFICIRTTLGAAFPDGPPMPGLAIEPVWMQLEPSSDLQAFIKQ